MEKPAKSNACLESSQNVEQKKITQFEGSQSLANTTKNDPTDVISSMHNIQQPRKLLY